ncbi:unnamed protein product [Urochloa decumbens]|uniref:Uncharacterized protein n=1 Tax=Urochloa decumbens TaxID=240449 RepID=A0ABC8ZKK9_9POAL
MARFLYRAAVAFAEEVLGTSYRPRPFSGLFLASAIPSAAGHLGLARASATPALRDLLTPGAFLLDATHALGAVALRGFTHTAEINRYIRDDFFPKELARAEAQGDARAADVLRLFRALIDAEDGRCQDALDDLARLAAERPDFNSARHCAAAFCDLLGRAEEGDRWLAGVPGWQRPPENISLNLGLVEAALGGAPGAVAGNRGQVASAAFQIINESVSEGKMSAFQTIVTGLLKQAAKRRCKDLPLKHGDGDGILRALADAVSGSVPKDDRPFFVLQASQALLSAVVLREPPLSGERVTAALRVAKRDLARAVEKGDAAAVSDLRFLAAFLAARDGRFDEALARYEEVARDDPSDPRPHRLAFVISVVVRRPDEEASKWMASYKRVAAGSSFRQRFEMVTLTDEMLVALALASPTAFDVRCPIRMSLIAGAAGRLVDAALVSALESKSLSVVERIEVRAARAFLHAGMWSALKKWEGKDYGISGTATE